MVCLILSSADICNTVITNERGRVLFKTDTPFRLTGADTTTIHKIKPNDDPHHMRNQFSVLGEIEWHRRTGSKFRTDGTEVEARQYMPMKGLSGSRQRVFRGRDGRPYCWDLQFKVLLRDDGSQMEVARFHRATLGSRGGKRKAMLEVSPEVFHMMDTVIMTFIYVQRSWRNNEENAQRRR